MRLPAKPLLGIGLLLTAMAGWWLSRQPGTEPSSLLAQSMPGGVASEQCRVLKIFDGDTLACDLNRNGRVDGKAEHVRLLGIDAPESRYSRKNKSHRDQPGATSATRWLESRVLNQTVSLRRDVRPTDKYNRVLAHLYVANSPTPVNQQLLENGLARLMFIEPNRAFKADYTAALEKAQAKRLGIWQDR